MIYQGFNYFYGSKIIESYLGKKMYDLILSPARTQNIFIENNQPKNNQNQMNTTGAQNLKKFDNTAGWLAVFCNEFIK